jgi:murein hydrolase activator
MKIILFFFTFFLVNSSFATNTDDKVIQLDKKINQLDASIVESQISYDNYFNKLQQIEVLISKLGADLALLQKKQFELKVKIKEKQRSFNKNKVILASYQKKLIQQIKAEYKIGSIQTMNLLLNQKSPHTLTRVLQYANILNQYRKKQINDTQKIFHKIAKNISEMKTAQKEFDLRQQKLKKENKKLQSAKLERVRLLKSTKTEIQNKTSQLLELKKQRTKLTNIITNTQKQPKKNAFKRHKNIKVITNFRGNLTWPLKGNIIHKYNSKRGIGDLRYQGIVIKAKDNTDVNAVYAGEVVYTGYLKNFGNIIIIKHPQSYISLYGFNEIVYKKIGEQVQEGEKIAQAGKSGGQKQNSLYFEIRKKTRPLNPSKWLK